MKTNNIPTTLSTLLACALMQLAVTSCSTSPSNSALDELTQSQSSFKQIDADENCPDLVGIWGNEGELRSMTLNADRTFEMIHHDNEESSEENIQGTWEQKGKKLTLRMADDMKWYGNKAMTFLIYDSKSDVEDCRGNALIRRVDGLIWAAFYRQ